MRSPQSECKVHQGDLDRVRLTEKHRGLSLHNPAGTGSAPAAPELQLPQKGPLPGELSGVCPGCVAYGRPSVCPTEALRGLPHSLPYLLGDEEYLHVQNFHCSGNGSNRSAAD